MHTPPPKQQRPQQQDAQQEASPATPAGAGAGGAAPPARGPGGTALRLKSALKPARLAAVQDDEGGEEATPAGAGVKKRVRIHSANNMVHEFQTSMSTDGVTPLPGLAAGHLHSEGASDDERTPDSGGPRQRRPSTPARPSLQRYSGFLANVFNGSSTGSSAYSSKGPSIRGSPHSARGRDLLGMLFTFSWMLASSALIFANKQLMVDHGVRFPLALTCLGQASSTLLGEGRGCGSAGHSTSSRSNGSVLLAWQRMQSSILGPSRTARGHTLLSSPNACPFFCLCSLAGVAGGARPAAPATAAARHAYAAAPSVAQLRCLAVPGERRLPWAVG